MIRVNFLIFFVFAFCCSFTDQKQTRLLLNDPTVLHNQLLRLENVIGAMNQTVNQMNLETTQHTASIRQLTSENQQLTSENLQMTKDIQQLTTQNQQQAAELTSLSSPSPAFFATLSSGVAIGNSQILKFNNVRINVGGGYDSITGVFIAPKPGTYHFTSVVYSNAVEDLETQMNKNNELLVMGYSSSASHAEGHTMNIVVSLVKGDHIYVQHRGGANDVARGEHHSTFSGFMISE